MHYLIFDTGAVVASSDDEADAMNAFVALAGAHPEHAAELVFLAFDDHWKRLGAPVLGSYLAGE